MNGSHTRRLAFAARRLFYSSRFPVIRDPAGPYLEPLPLCEMKSRVREMNLVWREINSISREMNRISREMDLVSREINPISRDITSISVIWPEKVNFSFTFSPRPPSNTKKGYQTVPSILLHSGIYSIRRPITGRR